jgi:hypothetical protein
MAMFHSYVKLPEGRVQDDASRNLRGTPLQCSLRVTKECVFHRLLLRDATVLGSTDGFYAVLDEDPTRLF